MNKILDLFDEKKVLELFRKDLLLLYPNFSDIIKIEIIPHKRNVWAFTYHVVTEFKTYFYTIDGETVILPIYCTAHSDEPRKNVYDGMQFLWRNSFSDGDLTVPRPLFFNEYYNATFYRGAEGQNLYSFIKEKNYSEIEAIIIKTAAWFAKLHSLDIGNAKNFNKENSRIATVFPGIEHILKKIKENYPKYYDDYLKIYNLLNNKENDFLSSTADRWLIHGDAHPENVIKMSENKIALIDFTDLCLADFARDLGTFMQQLDYMCGRKIGDDEFAQKTKELFLSNYLKETGRIQIDSAFQERIDNYYNWTAMRTTTHFLLKSDPEPERAEPLIDLVIKNLHF